LKHWQQNTGPVDPGDNFGPTDRLFEKRRQQADRLPKLFFDQSVYLYLAHESTTTRIAGGLDFRP
jgi:hypothetical protein